MSSGLKVQPKEERCSKTKIALIIVIQNERGTADGDSPSAALKIVYALMDDPSAVKRLGNRARH